MLYKVIDNELVSTKITEMVLENGIYISAPKAEEDLVGWKPLVVNARPTPSIYEIVVETFVENEENVEQQFEIQSKPLADIVALNTNFWEENFIKIELSEFEIYYIPKTTTDGTSYNLFQNEVLLNMITAPIGELTQLEVYAIPNYTQQFTSEYLDSVKIIITDIDKMTQILNKLIAEVQQPKQPPSLL